MPYKQRSHSYAIKSDITQLRHKIRPDTATTATTSTTAATTPTTAKAAAAVTLVTFITTL